MTTYITYSYRRCASTNRRRYDTRHDTTRIESNRIEWQIARARYIRRHGITTSHRIPTNRSVRDQAMDPELSVFLANVIHETYGHDDRKGKTRLEKL
ncbi:hypothetical protein RB195_003724 [Necator americanus]|uniref:Uncharacterized protein n=1 Tax=Necator americanus TaxID=51031 RepID=A0ABR1DPW2_NECAM